LAVRHEQLSTAATSSESKNPQKGPKRDKGKEINSAANSKDKENTAQHKGQGKKRFPCTLCEQTGHPTYQCPQMKEAKRLINKSNNKTHSKKEDNAEINLVLSTASTGAHSIAYDSCATEHIIKDRFMLSNLRQIKPIRLLAANKTTFTATEAGDLVIKNKESDQILTLKNALYVPQASRNLLSAHPLVEDGFEVKLSGEESAILKDSEVILPIIHHGKLPFIDGYVETTPQEYAFAIDAANEGKAATERSINYGIVDLGILGQRL